MQKDLTEVVFILDRSGSMGGKERDTIGAFNSLIEKQKKLEGRVLVTTILFDDQYEVLFERIPLEKVRPITSREYYVRGCTALLDAVGLTVDAMRKLHHEDGKYVPAHTLFVINTDGMENASRVYSFNDVRGLITHEREKHGWDFLFLGANMDAIATASQIGIQPSMAACTYADSSGIQAQYCSVGRAMKASRMNMCVADSDWSADIAADASARTDKKAAKANAKAQTKVQAQPQTQANASSDDDIDDTTEDSIPAEDEIEQILAKIRTETLHDDSNTDDSTED
ncbi:MAG: hypothetical protein LUD51_07735 [Clostridia bacterium]|nr:hypothetical protein [Clostridia bacterium]